jgi:uncharacterized protein (DUF983 family)
MNENELPRHPPLIGPDGFPARRPEDQTCPRCGAEPDKRRLSSGFGAPHDVCGVCGFEFEERTRDQ